MNPDLNVKIKCPACNTENVQVQVVNEAILKTKHHSIVWWLTVGWIWTLIKWLVFTIPALIIKVFGLGKKQKIVNITKKKGVCQQCGNVFDIG